MKPAFANTYNPATQKKAKTSKKAPCKTFLVRSIPSAERTAEAAKK